ncbi:unnamed protein product, partial [Ectocarpus sp. 12 AP-2014]
VLSCVVARPSRPESTSSCRLSTAYRSLLHVFAIDDIRQCDNKELPTSLMQPNVPCARCTEPGVPLLYVFFGMAFASLRQLIQGSVSMALTHVSGSGTSRSSCPSMPETCEVLSQTTSPECRLGQSLPDAWYRTHLRRISTSGAQKVD